MSTWYAARFLAKRSSFLYPVEASSQYGFWSMRRIESAGFSNGMALPQKLRSDMSGCVVSWVSWWMVGGLSNVMVE